ncbi:MAG: hypothetical protein RIB97_01050 [Nitratireductor sp.]
MAATSKKRSAATAADVGHDPLVVAINAYRFDGDRYDHMAETLDGPELSEAFDRLVQQHTDALEAWQAPARSIESVAAALRVVVAELEWSGEEPLAASMARAALGFFDGARPRAALAVAQGVSLRGGTAR